MSYTVTLHSDVKIIKIVYIAIQEKKKKKKKKVYKYVCSIALVIQLFVIRLYASNYNKVTVYESYIERSFSVINLNRTSWSKTNHLINVSYHNSGVALVLVRIQVNQQNKTNDR